jgi:hypothetical protein
MKARFEIYLYGKLVYQMNLYNMILDYYYHKISDIDRPYAIIKHNS